MKIKEQNRKSENMKNASTRTNNETAAVSVYKANFFLI